MAKAIEKFDNDFSNNDFDGVVEAIPAKIIEKIANKASTDLKKLKAAMKTQMTSAMETVKLHSFSMDVDEAKIEQTTTGRLYSLVPTTLSMSIPSLKKKIDIDTHTLAIHDNNKWYLMRVESPQHIEILSEVYPDLKGLKFPKPVQKISDN